MKLPDSRLKLFDEGFVLKDKKTGEPVANRLYRIRRADGSYENGTYPTELRETVLTGVAVLSYFTTMPTFSHEFIHCLGVPDEYSHNLLQNRIVNYYQPDGSLDSDIVVLPKGYPEHSDHPSGNIMSEVASTETEVRHAWNIAIEARTLMKKKTGRDIQCDILRA